MTEKFVAQVDGRLHQHPHDDSNQLGSEKETSSSCSIIFKHCQSTAISPWQCSFSLTLLSIHNSQENIHITTLHNQKKLSYGFAGIQIFSWQAPSIFQRLRSRASYPACMSISIANLHLLQNKSKSNEPRSMPGNEHKIMPRCPSSESLRNTGI